MSVQALHRKTSWVGSYRTTTDDVLAGLPVVAWEIRGAPDASGHVQHISSSAAALFGSQAHRQVTPAAFWQHIVHPGDRERLAAAMKGVFTSGTADTIRIRCRTENQRGLRMQVTAIPVLDAGSRVVGLRGVMTDIGGGQPRTHRRLADANILGVLLWDAEGTITDANDAFLAMVGYDREDLTAGRIKWDVVTPGNDTQRDQRARAEVAASGTAAPFEKEFCRKDGSRLHALIGSTAFDDESGGGVSYVLDITPYKRRVQEQQALAELSQHALNHDLSSTLARAAAVVQQALDVELCRIFLRDGAQIRLVASASSESGPDQQSEPDSQVLFTAEHAAPSTVEDWTKERQLTPPVKLIEGGFVASVTVAIGDQNGVQGVIGIYSRKTRRLVSEETVFLQAAANLVSNAVSRHQTAEAVRVHEEQLRERSKLEALGRLAGGIAHDFNNLLTAILGYADLASNRHPAVRAELYEICRATQSAADLVRQLLAFSSRQVLRPHRINLNDTVADIGRLLHRLVGENIELACTPCSEAVAVRVDPVQIEQVIINLVLNARDAIRGHGRISVSTAVVNLNEDPAAPKQSCLPAGRYARLTVADTGAGMDESTKSRIFEPFFTTKQPGKGTGLGLATVYGIVQQSHGSIVVESQPEHGSVFTVYVPVAEERRAADSPLRKIASRTAGTEAVLLVEDNDGVRESLSAGLARFGYQVFAAAAPDQALTIASEQRVQTLVTDMVLPSMNGKSLARQVRAIQPHIRILFMTGYLNASADDASVAIITKPFTSEELASRLRQVLDDVAQDDPKAAAAQLNAPNSTVNSETATTR